MPNLIPFEQSQNNYTIIVPLTGAPYSISVRFNSIDNAWYMDLYDEDQEPILMNIKIVLGSRIGRTSSHAFFKTHLLSVVDTAATGRDAGYDDLGGRIQVQVVDTTEVIS